MKKICLLLIIIAALIFIKIRNRKPGGNFFDPIPPHYENNVYEKPSSTTVKIYTQEIKKIILPILMYHYVEYVKDPKDTIRKSLDVNPYNFGQQLKTLTNNGYTTYFVRDIPDIFSGKIKTTDKNVVLTFDDGYEDFYTDAFPLLKKYNIKATIYIVYDFIGRRGFLTETEIKELIASGLVELGSHTLDHLYLKSVTLETARKQIIDSKRLLEEKFSTKVETFAYPYGVFTDLDIALVNEAGYKAAVTVTKGILQSDNEIFRLYRIRAGGFEGKNMLKMLGIENKVS